MVLVVGFVDRWAGVFTSTTKAHACVDVGVGRGTGVEGAGIGAGNSAGGETCLCEAMVEEEESW